MTIPLTLNGKDEFNIKNNKKYKVNIINSYDDEKYMTKYFQNFIKLSTKNTSYLGIDFEFNKITKGTRDVALMQLNLENNNSGEIFILHPPSLLSTNSLIELLTSDNIIKILHGSESLDIPYLYNQLLIRENLIIKFNKNFYDTKILCEYTNSAKCSIYELLLDKKIISKNKLDELEEIEEKMGPIYLIQINIKKLTDELLKYSVYDVLFLPELFKVFYSEIEKSNINLLSELFGIINLDKRTDFLNLKEIKTELDSYNNVLMDVFEYKIRLNDMQDIYYNMFLYSNNKIFKINYFKYFILILIKFSTYKIFISLSSNLNWIEKFSNSYNFFKYINDTIESDLIE